MSETGSGPEESEESGSTQESTTRGRRTKKVLGVAAEELKDWRGERLDAAAQRRAELRTAADEAHQAHFDPILTNVEGNSADASGTFGGDNQTGTESPRDVDALTRMAVAERDAPPEGSEWPLDGLRRRVEALPGDVGQWRENRKERREQKAREAVEAANIVAEAEAAGTPERTQSQQRADQYIEDLEREKLFADSRKGISTVNIEIPDDELRQVLYDEFDVKEAENWTRQSDVTKSKNEIWQGWKHPGKIIKMPWRAAIYAKDRFTGLTPMDAGDTSFEVRRYLASADNSTVIEEVFHQRRAAVEGDVEAGDMSLASTRLIHVKGGAYEEKGDKLVATKAFAAFQKLPRTQTSEIHTGLEPSTQATLPVEGPKPGSLPHNESEMAAEEYVLPPAPDLGPGAVVPTPRPAERRPPAPEPEPESESESEPELETVSAPPLETADETPKTGRKARRPRVQDLSQHPQLLDPSRPIEQRPYDGIARGSRLNEPGGDGLNTRRANRPEGPVAVSAPESIGRPDTPETENQPAQAAARLEYSVETGRVLEEDGYSGFSELVHRIQDKDSRFGVPLSGELTHPQVGILLDAAESSDEVESLEQELVKRDIQHRKDTKSNRPPLMGAGGKLVGRNESERVLVREIERKYEKIRQAELDAERKRTRTLETQPEPEVRSVEPVVELELQRRATQESTLDIPESDAVRKARVARERELNRRGRRGGGSGKGGASRGKAR